MGTTLRAATPPRRAVGSARARDRSVVGRGTVPTRYAAQAGVDLSEVPLFPQRRRSGVPGRHRNTAEPSGGSPTAGPGAGQRSHCPAWKPGTHSNGRRAGKSRRPREDTGAPCPTYLPFAQALTDGFHRRERGRRGGQRSRPRGAPDPLSVPGGERRPAFSGRCRLVGPARRGRRALRGGGPAAGALHGVEGRRHRCKTGGANVDG
jgi:hypothetical protein